MMMFRRVALASSMSLSVTSTGRRTVVHTFEGPDVPAEIKKADGKVGTIIDCYADWCGPCIQFSPKYDEMSERYPNVRFVKMNVEEFEDVGAEFGLRSVPTFLVFDKEGGSKAKIEGASPIEIEKALSRLA
jgi:thioredoxin 1